MSLANKQSVVSGCRKVCKLDGHAAEVGVYKGESARWICEELPETIVHLFDTFSGMPSLSMDCDGHREGEFHDTSVEHVERTLQGLSNYRLYPGLFPGTATGFNHPLKLVHIDCDLYVSTHAALSWCWPLLVEHGVVVCDDYGAWKCEGAKVAIDDFIARHDLETEVFTSGRLHLCKR